MPETYSDPLVARKLTRLAVAAACGIAGALLWRRHRMTGFTLGAVAGKVVGGWFLPLPDQL